MWAYARELRAESEAAMTGGAGTMEDDEEEEDDDDDDDDDEKRIYERELTRDVTERTVEAIRGLAVKGILSKEQKRRLLSDIVKHHQVGTLEPLSNPVFYVEFMVEC